MGKREQVPAEESESEIIENRGIESSASTLPTFTLGADSSSASSARTPTESINQT